MSELTLELTGDGELLPAAALARTVGALADLLQDIARNLQSEAETKAPGLRHEPVAAIAGLSYDPATTKATVRVTVGWWTAAKPTGKSREADTDAR